MLNPQKIFILDPRQYITSAIKRLLTYTTPFNFIKIFEFLRSLNFFKRLLKYGIWDINQF